MASESDTQFVQQLGELFNQAAAVVNNSFQSTFNYRKTKKLMALNQSYYEKNMDLAQGYNEKNMALQNDYAISAENRANAYNDPSAQRARLQMAGLSPALAGADSGIQGSISSAPSSSAPQGYSPSPSWQPNVPMMSISPERLLEFEKQRAEIQNINANTRKTEADAQGSENTNSIFDTIFKPTLEANKDNAVATARLNQLQVDYKNATQQQDIEMKGVELASFYQSLDNLRKDGIIKDEQVNLIKAQTDAEKVNKQVLEKQIPAIIAKTNLDNRQAQMLGEKLKRFVKGLPADTDYSITALPSVVIETIRTGEIWDYVGDALDNSFGRFGRWFGSLFEKVGIDSVDVVRDKD